MSARLLAIGDIHGCSLALDALLTAIDPRPDDTIVTLGDYVDRGPDARGTIDRLIALADRCRLVPLIGNHDEMMLDARRGRGPRRDWLDSGGLATLQSYDQPTLDAIPAAHFAFLEACRDTFEADDFFFVHANYLESVPIDRQPHRVTRWEKLRDRMPGPHASGKTAIVGHTSQKDGEVLDHGHVKCIDTYCYGGRWLTALDVGSGRLWQADAQGRLR